MAFEYYLDADHTFNTPFQAQLAEYLSTAYMDYINGRNLSVKESDVGFDLTGDGSMEDIVQLTIEYDPEAYPETNGYHGAYLDLYLAQFHQSLQWYLDNLDYAEGWTWFDESGNALSDQAVAAMTGEDKARAFIEGRYTKSAAGRGMGGPGGGMPGGMGGPDGMEGGPGGEMGGPDGFPGAPGEGGPAGNDMIVGTPDAGTTQSATAWTDSANYERYEDMVAVYRADIEEIEAGDQFGNNIVSLYNPLDYIGAEGAEQPAWTKILMGAAEGDISMLNSLNLQIAWLAAGVDAALEWQWDGGHVPSEALGDSFSLYVDQMYGKHDNGTVITKAEATPQAANGDADEAAGTDLSDWVSHDDVSNVSFSLADAAAYRTAGANKATPGFDVIDYGQEDYVFGNTQVDARHWNRFLLEIFEAYADELEPLFNQG